MNTQNPKLSIIIPFKNTELIWMDKLFESIEKQTNNNFEVICIDDDSDNGIDYKKYIEIKGWKYFKNENNSLGFGVGKLRDYGVSIAQGKYIWFLDSDDWITNDAVEYLLNSFLKHKDIDLIVFKYKWVFNFKDGEYKQKKYNDFVLNNEPTRKMNQWFHKDFQTDWRVCFKKEFLLNNKIIHKDFLLLYEDVYFGLIWKTIYKKALFSTKILYYYNRMNVNSTLNIRKNFNPNTLLLNIMSSKDTLIKMNKFNDKWYFYANNWSFIAASCRPYKDRKENKVLIRNVIGPRYYRTIKMLGFGKTWWSSNFVVKRLLLIAILKKILKIYAY